MGVTRCWPRGVRCEPGPRGGGPLSWRGARVRLLETSTFSNAYDANGTQLRATLVDRVVQAPYTVLGWRVLDIVATIRALGEAGVAFQRYGGMAQNEDGVWIAPGGQRVAWCADLDGNVLSLQQPPTA